MLKHKTASPTSLVIFYFNSVNTDVIFLKGTSRPNAKSMSQKETLKNSVIAMDLVILQNEEQARKGEKVESQNVTFTKDNIYYH